MNLPFSPSADRNKHAILKALSKELVGDELILEIGSGTGQHACHFAANLPNILWQPSELKDNIPTIKSRIREQHCHNLLDPYELDVDVLPWPVNNAHVCYTSNTFHIVSMQSIQSIFAGCKQVLGHAGKLCVYGPFSINGSHTSQGNIQFDQQLRASGPASGIRDLQELDGLAKMAGFCACRCVEMPANNLFVVWDCE